MVPHMLRMLMGPDHRGLMPLSFLGGAALLTLADTIARIAVQPAEIPVVILCALLGAPFFLGLLLHWRSEEHTSELQSLLRILSAIFRLKTKSSNMKHVCRFVISKSQ